MSTNDMWTENTDRDEQILQAAEKILQKRLLRKGRISEPSDAAEYLRAHCAHLEHEIFGLILLDTRHQILDIVDLFRGTIDGAAVEPREVCKTCLFANASAVILFHNHPSSSLEVSENDKAVTARIKQALSLLDIRVLDHIIVSAAGTTSMALRGML
jgi:DNA repair protein RadC